MERIKIGWGMRDVSTTEPVTVPGQMYMRISEGIHDPVCVTALCVDGGAGQDCVIFLSCDVVVLRGGVIEQTREKALALDPTVPADKIVMNATHTHAGGCITDNKTDTSPDGRKIMRGQEYRAFFTDMAAQAAVEAWQSRRPGGFAYGYGYAVVAHSRRSVYFEDMSQVVPSKVAPNGHAVMYGKTDRPEFSHYEAGADHFLNVLFTFDEKDALTGMIVNVPCPSQLSERFNCLSADFWNEVRQGVKKEFGEGVYVLPQAAAAGDLSPRILHYREAQRRRFRLKYGLEYEEDKCSRGNEQEQRKVMAERYDIAERIMDAVKDVYSWAKKEIFHTAPVEHRVLNMDLTRRIITDEEAQWLRDNIAKMEKEIPAEGAATPEEIRIATSTYNAVKGRNTRALERYEDIKTHPTLSMPAHILRIGDVAFSTIRFELYMDYMHRIQARSPFLQTFVVELAGAEGGNYLATVRGAANKGYSASIFCNMVDPKGGQEYVENVLKELNEMKAKDNA